MTPEMIGVLASSFVLLSSSMKDMRWLRLLSLMSNICFVTYGMVEGLMPILTLHGILIPINAYHCWASWKDRLRPAATENQHAQSVCTQRDTILPMDQWKAA